jgi:hypothetical protein
MIDYRKALFKIEQVSPFLARKFWVLKSMKDTPLALTLGLKINLLSDLVTEVEVPLLAWTKNDLGELHPSLLLAAGEFTARLLWQRHLNPHREEIRLRSIQGQFLQPVISAARVRTELLEGERERILRKLRSSQGSFESEMSLVFLDKKDQNVATVNCVWEFISKPQGQPGQLQLPTII